MNQDAVLQACSDELDKIALSDNSKRRVGQAAVGAAIGGSTTALMYAPVTAAIKSRWGNKAAALLTALNAMRGATLGALVGAAIPPSRLRKTAAMWGEGQMPTWGAGRPSGGFVTQHFSAGMAKQPGTSTTNTSGLLKNLSNVPSAGLESPAKLPGAKSLKMPTGGKSLSIKPIKSTSSASKGMSKL